MLVVANFQTNPDGGAYILMHLIDLKTVCWIANSWLDDGFFVGFEDDGVQLLFPKFGHFVGSQQLANCSASC